MTIPRWREIQRGNFTSLTALADYLELDETHRCSLARRSDFPLNLPRRLAAKIAKNSLTDPLLLQFVPLEEEQSLPFTNPDPTHELAFQKQERLLQKYSRRALIIASGGCAMHCRYCFRQHFPYPQKSSLFLEELNLIRADPTLDEIILSGGDPLTLGNDKLAYLIAALGEISHLKRLRIHTRFPVGIPERIDDEFCEILAKSTLQVIFVVHINHPIELDQEVIAALKRIQRLAIPILNQSVLLRGVNDSVDTLEQLSTALMNAGILPYYLHHLDPVKGASRFDTPICDGKALIEGLQERISGYGVPRYVQEIPFKKSKTAL